MPPKTVAKEKGFQALVLSEKGDVTQVTIPNKSGAEVTIATIKTFLKKKTALELIGTYPYKQLFLFLIAATTGKEGTENKHQLPPPHDVNTLYGDIVLIASKDEESFTEPQPFSTDDYEQFYTKSFGGYESGEEGAEAEVEAEADIDVDDAAEEEPAEEGKEFVQEEEEEDGEDDEDEEEDAEAEVEGGDEDVPIVIAKPKAKKRKVAKVNPGAAFTATAFTAYPDKPNLSEDEQLQEESNTAGKPTIPIRIQSLKALQKIFEGTLEADQILALESSIYNGALREARRRHIVRSWDYPLFIHLYRMHARHISANFHPESYVGNKDLFNLFQSGGMTLAGIAGLNTYELFPSRWKDQFNEQQIREKRQLEGNKAMATDQFLCTRCWKRECTYYEMQTRSADEPMTIFITCVNCGKHWRQ